MRERHLLTSDVAFKRRITPAYAGKTEAEPLIRFQCQDHPRVCGKDGVGFASVDYPIGSPPRMRERPMTKTIDTALLRITPAYAGKTATLPRCSRSAEDHPRVCGKDWAALSLGA